MKKLALIILMLFGTHLLKAQFVTIPDPDFRNFLMTQFPSCFNASNDMDTTCAAIVNCVSLYYNIATVTSVDGIQYFDNLDSLSVAYTQISSLPPLPHSLSFLNCSNNLLSSLPILPSSLSSLNCSNNLLSSLPILPSSLSSLNCSNNLLSSLPILPNSLIFLKCIGNQLISLPSLPSGLQYLYCEVNQLSSLPILPSSLHILYCNNNQLSSLPILPSSLNSLNCASNQLGALPSLPNNLTDLNVQSNQLSALPSLTNNLINLNCSSNQLSTLPSLPNSLNFLFCFVNQLTSLPSLPNSLNLLQCHNNQLISLPSLPNSLNTVDCSANQLSTLPLLPNSLNSLNCSANQLSTLPTLPDSLNSLNCTANQLSALPNLPNGLAELYCDFNQLNTLPSLPNNLIGLLCGFNQLSTLPSLPNSLDYLSCGFNQLLYLPNLPNSLVHLYCSNNQLSSLPSLSQNLAMMTCDSNISLNCLPLLPNTLLSLVTDGTTITCIPNFPTNLTGGSGALLPLCSSGSTCEPAPTASGMVYLDINSNTIYDAGDTVLPNSLIVNSVNSWSTTSTINGEYQIKLDSGVVNTFGATPPTPYYTSFPVNYTITPTSSGSAGSNYNFGIQLIPNVQDVMITLAQGPARPGFNQWVNVMTGNVGTIDVNNASVKLLKPNSFIFTDANPPISTTSGDTLIWNNINLNILEQKGFMINWTIPVTALLGAPYQLQAWIAPIASDTIPNNNHAIFNGVFQGSYDPNDKTVNNTEVNPLTVNNELQYTIRFQNTGTDTAFNIVVRDQLSSNLDLSTFKMLGASHSYSYLIREHGLLEVFFQNILLPDSNINEPASHGFLSYSIKPKASITTTDTINNIAEIYFDFNAPIFTNNAQTVYVITSVENIATIDAQIFPNPANNYVDIKCPKVDVKNIQIELLNSIGQRIAAPILHQQNEVLRVDVSHLTKGIYIGKIKTNKGTKVFKLVKE